VPLDNEKIKSLRTKKGLTQAQAAKAARIGGRQRWHDIESGRKGGITVTTLDRVAAALGVHARELLK
jgi:transcriptional regulator with XRE-family HTH domain